MSSVVISGNTSGTITLDAPAVAGTTTLTLPTTNGTVLTNGTNANFPAGSVLQVVNATVSTPVTNNTNVLADTGLTASITPSSASNKILVIVDQSGVGKTASDTAVILALIRDASSIVTFSSFAGQTSTAAVNTIGGCGVNYLDSPNTTSSTTYKTMFSSFSNTNGVAVQKNSETSTITLMEIKG